MLASGMDALSAWEGWRGALRGEVAADTWRQYVPAVMRFLALTGLARTPVEEITRTDILTFYGEHYARGGWAKVGCHAALSHYFQWMVYEGIISPEANPMAFVKIKHPAPNEEAESLTADELGAIVAAIEHWRGRRAALAVLLSYCLATRRREICGVRDPEDFTLTNDGWLVVLRETKNGQPRNVPLSDTSLDIIREMRSLPARYRRRSREGFLVGVEPATFSDWVDRGGKLAGIPEEKTHSHILRASFASDALADGADVRTIQRILGHANLRTTMRYLRPDAKKKREAAELVGARAAAFL